MTEITVLGTGFAALTAVRKLRAMDKKLAITVIAPKPELVYLPSLIWLPSGQRQPEDIVVPLQNFFRNNNINYVQGKAKSLSNDGRVVSTLDAEIGNDGLIIATGGQFIKKLPGIEHALTPCEGVAPVMQFTQKLAEMDEGTLAFGFAGNPNEPTAMRGGPMFEFLFGTDQLLRKQGRRDKFKLVFFSPAPKPGIRLGEKVVPKFLQRMEKLGITTHLGHKMVRFEEKKVVTQGGEFAADLIMFMPGMTGNSWFNNTELPRSPGGLIASDKHCKVAGFERVYVAGDSGSFPGPDWMPKQAHMADLQAEVAAKNLLAEVNNQPSDHEFRVELFCIVDDNASGALVARTSRLSLTLPPMGLGHLAKSWFEKIYLKRYK